MTPLSSLMKRQSAHVPIAGREKLHARKPMPKAGKAKPVASAGATTNKAAKVAKVAGYTPMRAMGRW